jgi:hypothetical protein
MSPDLVKMAATIAMVPNATVNKNVQPYMITVLIIKNYLDWGQASTSRLCPKPESLPMAGYLAGRPES